MNKFFIKTWEKRYLIKKVNLKLVPKGYTFRDKSKILFCLLILAPLRKIGLTKKEMLITMKNEDCIYLCGDKNVHTIDSNYEKPLRNFFDLKEGVFIDVGANIGRYTIMMAKRLKDKGMVVCIEPEPHTVELLKTNVAMNKLKNVFVVDKVCYSENGEKSFYLEDTIYGGNTNALTKLKHHVKELIIESETLDSIISRLKIKTVNLIKIDVEGSELEVLRGAKNILKDYHPKIIYEALDDKCEKEIACFLKRFKYNIKRINKGNFFAYRIKGEKHGN